MTPPISGPSGSWRNRAPDRASIVRLLQAIAVLLLGAEGLSRPVAPFGGISVPGLAAPPACGESALGFPSGLPAAGMPAGRLIRRLSTPPLAWRAPEAWLLPGPVTARRERRSFGRLRRDENLLPILT